MSTWDEPALLDLCPFWHNYVAILYVYVRQSYYIVIINMYKLIAMLHMYFGNSYSYLVDNMQEEYL